MKSSLEFSLPRVRRHGCAMLVCSVLLAAGAAMPAHAGQTKYGYDDDPIRLGDKALGELKLDVARGHFEDAIATGYEVPKAKFGLAEVMVYSARFKEAEALYREAIDASMRAGEKSFADAHAGLGILLADSERWTEAAEEINVAYEQNSGLWPAIYGEARLELHARKWEKAKRFLDYGAARKGLPEGKDLYHRGMALYHLGLNDLQAAEIEALNAFHMNPADPRHGILLAQIYEKRNVPALAIAACEEVLSAPGATPTATFVHFTGTLYEKADRYNEARDHYLRAIEIDSVYAPAYKDLADLYQLAKQHDRASQVYLKYVELEPTDIEGLVGLSEALNDSGRNVQALSTATKAMELDSTRADVRLAFARSAIRSRTPSTRDHGAATFAALGDSVTLDADDHVAIGAYQMDKKDLDSARRSLATAIEMDSTSADAYFQMGQLSFKTGHPDSAASYFETAIRLDSKTPLYYLNLGVARFQLKEMDRALPAFRQALALDPKSVLAHNLLGQALASMDSLAAAEAEYQQALELEPKNGRALRGMGFCHLRAAEHDKAVEAYRLATSAEPRNAEGWVGLGQAYLGLRDLEEAESAFRKAQSIDPSNPSVKQGIEIINQSRRSAGG